MRAVHKIADVCVVAPRRFLDLKFGNNAKVDQSKLVLRLVRLRLDHVRATFLRPSLFHLATFALGPLSDANVIWLDISMHVMRLVQYFEWQQNLPK